MRSSPLLKPDQPLRDAVGAVLDSGLPALPVVDGEGRCVGLFGEREFIAAVFPGYMKELKYAAFVPHSLDDALEKRGSCAGEPVSEHMNTEHIELDRDASDAAVAETFLHHRVLVIPITEDDRVVGVITRADFFRELAERIRS
jgi:CBS domain-containing protein